MKHEHVPGLEWLPDDLRKHLIVGHDTNPDVYSYTDITMNHWHEFAHLSEDEKSIRVEIEIIKISSKDLGEPY